MQIAARSQSVRPLALGIVAGLLLTLSGCGDSSDSASYSGGGASSSGGGGRSGTLASRIANRGFKFGSQDIYTGGSMTEINTVAFCAHGNFAWEQVTSSSMTGALTHTHTGTWSLRGSTLMLNVRYSTAQDPPSTRSWNLSVSGGSVAFNGRAAMEEGDASENCRG